MAFSREFVHIGQAAQYDSLQVCPTTGSVVCKTSFERQKVRTYLDANPSADEIRVIEVRQDGKYYFALLALQNGGPLDDPLVGDLPCPKECIPPAFIGNTSFDPNHVSDVIDVPGCEWLQVHRSKVNVQSTYDDFTIYALTDDGHGGWNEENDPGDEMYTTDNS